MEPREINSIENAFDYFEDALNEGMALLDPEDRLGVKRASSLDPATYTPDHPLGELLLAFPGDNFGSPENKQDVIQDRDLRLTVVSVIRWFSEKEKPEYYLDWIVDTISGLEVLRTNRAEKKIHSVGSEFMAEKNKIWWHLTTFNVPLKYFETSLRT